MSVVRYVKACPHCCKQEHRTLQLLHNHRSQCQEPEIQLTSSFIMSDVLWPPRLAEVTALTFFFGLTRTTSPSGSGRAFFCFAPDCPFCSAGTASAS